MLRARPFCPSRFFRRWLGGAGLYELFFAHSGFSLLTPHTRARLSHSHADRCFGGTPTKAACPGSRAARDAHGRSGGPSRRRMRAAPDPDPHRPHRPTHPHPRPPRPVHLERGRHHPGLLRRVPPDGQGARPGGRDAGCGKREERERESVYVLSLPASPCRARSLSDRPPSNLTIFFMSLFTQNSSWARPSTRWSTPP